jgi:uncharacterized sporulation protein YeaH/YhbH (DUF444 family)
MTLNSQPETTRQTSSNGDAFDNASLGIGPDIQRFRDIVKGKVREDLQEYITSDEIIAQHGNEHISVPVKEITIPRFVFGSEKEGVGEGDGQEGDGDGDANGAGKKGGKGEGKHIREETFHIEELADLLGEKLELPRIKPRLTSGLEAAVPRYESIARKGPPSLRDHRRTFLEALKRSIAEGTYNAEDPTVIPVKDDFRYRSPRLKPRPKTNAVIFYLIDVSGSMGDLEKSLARNTAFWTDAWIDRQYKGTEKCYIIHDFSAKVVDRDTFFTTRESGGTLISSAYQLAREQMATRFPPDEWNIYMFHFSDGENSSTQDDKLSIDILKESIVPFVNLFGYVEVGEHRRNGDFVRSMTEEFGDEEGVVITSMEDRGDIIPGIQDLLGTGR